VIMSVFRYLASRFGQRTRLPSVKFPWPNAAMAF